MGASVVAQSCLADLHKFSVLNLFDMQNFAFYPKTLLKFEKSGLYFFYRTIGIVSKTKHSKSIRIIQIVYLFCQKYIIKGVAAGAVKG